MPDSKDTKKEQDKAYQKAYYEANKEKIKARYKTYYEANKEKIKARYKTYYEANKALHEAIKAKHEAIKAKHEAEKRARGKWTKKDYIAYIKEEMDKVEAALDAAENDKAKELLLYDLVFFSEKLKAWETS